jgi:UDP-3-O-[3-hydroxymyristoyl] N-acetylglucosamine deacetylase
MLKSVYQYTVKSAITINGVGVHSGAPVRMVIKPAFANTGIVFIRSDIQDKENTILARWDHVIDTRLCTVLGNRDGVSVSTVEHLLSAFAAMGVDNAVVDINGAEVPIMDGSAKCFVEALDAAGLLRQQAFRRILRIKKAVTYREGDKEVTLSPANGQFFGFDISFDNALIGQQKLTHEVRETSYREDIASARTFGFLHEVEQLRQMGLAKGGSLDNAVVIDGDKIMNPDGLRFENEFVRHKILDAVGDIYLAGAQMIGRYHGVKAGHAMNNKALHALFADADAFEFVELGRQPVSRPIRQAAPMGHFYGDRESIAAIVA